MLTKDKVRAVYYTRVSTVDQAASGYSLGAQQKVIAEYCDKKGYQLIGGYSDEGISGKSIDQRPQIQDLLEDSRNDEFDVVIIWKLSRLSRSLIDTLSIIEELNRHEVALESVSEKMETKTPTNRFMVQMISSMNELERNIITIFLVM